MLGKSDRSSGLAACGVRWLDSALQRGGLTPLSRMRRVESFLNEIAGLTQKRRQVHPSAAATPGTPLVAQSKLTIRG
jgi:hypothetical protein